MEKGKKGRTKTGSNRSNQVRWVTALSGARRVCVADGKHKLRSARKSVTVAWFQIPITLSESRTE
jgi:hypothetical protein